MNTLIQVRQLTKTYGDKTALRGISFEVGEGEILCLLGPNGAGKSTTIHLLTTALMADAGEIFFRGRKVRAGDPEYKRCLGIVPQDLAVYEEISAEQNVRFFASLYGMRGRELTGAVTGALEAVGLSDRRRDKVKTFSGGMKRRLNIACAIAHKPQLIVMDEPTVGIDPQSRNHILQTIRELRDGGATILYTTHYMEEVEEISTRIVIVDHGQIIAEGTNEQLKEQLADEKLLTIGIESGQTFQHQSLYRIEGIRKVEFAEHELKIAVLKGIENLDKIISQLMDSRVKIRHITTEADSLETVFLKLTGRTLRD